MDERRILKLRIDLGSKTLDLTPSTAQHQQVRVEKSTCSAAICQLPEIAR